MFSNFINEYNYLNHDELKSLMKYLSLLLLSVLFIPIVQVAHAQNIVEEIGQAFNNLTSGMMGGNQSSNNASSTGSANQSSNNASSTGSANETTQDVGSIQELQNLTSGNQEALTNNTSLSGGNTSLGQGMEQEQYVEPENQSNALSAANNTAANNTQ